MRISIMQPYFLPYIGYWQLITGSDQFVILDDVNYIKRGWINRNRIMAGDRALWITLPLSKASQNRMIKDIDIFDDDGWKAKMVRTVRCSYSNAPRYEEGIAFFEEVLRKAEGNLSSYLAELISMIMSEIGIEASLIRTSSVFQRKGLTGQDRIIDICKELGATEYINLPGGRDLYERERFLEEGIQLRFMEAKNKMELCRGSDIVRPPSVLDAMMYNRPKEIRRAFANFRISRDPHEA